MASDSTTFDTRAEVAWCGSVSGAVQRELRRVFFDVGMTIMQTARRNAPVGRYAVLQRSILFKQFSDGNVSVFVGTMPAPGRSYSERPANLPLWLEYGTRRAGAKPYLLPAANGAKSELERRTAEALAAAVEE